MRSRASIAVRGDSTALGQRGGLAKLFRLAPSFDRKRWWVLLGASYNPPRSVFNDGVGGFSMAQIHDAVQHDTEHRDITTIIYDRRNTGEAPDQYLDILSDVIALLETSKFLIIPQVAYSASFAETVDQTTAMKRIDASVMDRWPDNTFSAEERRAFVISLAPDDTRHDGLHRNAKGQAIEAGFIKKWLAARDW